MGPTRTSAVKRPIHATPPIQRIKRFPIFGDKLFVGFVLASIFLCIATVVVILIKVRPKDFVVPLQYSTVQGFDALGAWYRIYVFGVFSLLVTVGNLFLASKSYTKSRLASFLLVLGTVIINLFGLVVALTLASHLEL